MQCILCKIYFWKVFHKYYNFICTPICTKFLFLQKVGVTHFYDFQRHFLPDFLLCDLRSFSLIPSMDLGARTSSIIYLQPWSESIAQAPSISRISTGFPKT
jgi:hypothetical protein